MGGGASAAGSGVATLTDQEIDRITPVGSLVSRVALEQLRDMQNEAHASREEIARMDAAFLRGQMRKRWKQHAVIVKRITCKNKQQLHRLKLKYSSPVESGGQGRDIVADVREMLGGPYGEFVRSMFLSWLDNAVEYIECAVAGIGCDDTMLIDVLCLATPAELAELNQFMGPMTANGHAVVNMKKLLGKTRKGSCFQLFLIRALEGDRPADGPLSVDQRAALKQAKAIHEALHHSATPDYAAFFNVICSASRQQCGLIGDEYILSYNMSLAQVINANFQGSIQRAIIMWISPRADAFALAMHHAMTVTADIDMEAAAHAAARIAGCVDKQDASTWLRERYQSMFSDKIEDKITSKVNGKLRDALLGWLDEESFDSNLEQEIAELVRLRGGAMDEDEGSTISAKAMSPLAKTLMNVTNVNAVRELLDREASTLRAYLAELEASGNDENTTTGGDAKSDSTASTKEKVNAARMASDNAKASRKISAPDASLSTKQAAAVDFQVKFERMCKYLKASFQVFDVDRSGALDTAEFWELISNLNLGFTGHEIEGMRAWCDWDQNGQISYAESVNELADHVITTMEANGQDVMAQLDSLELANLEKRTQQRRTKREQAAAESLAPGDPGEGDATGPAIPPSLNQYLFDSFQNYDTDKSGTLDMSEFWPFITSVFSHNFTEADLEDLQSAFDADGDGMVTWEEALSTFTKKIGEMRSDRRDHWLGLVDKTSGMLFWYNLRDETSFWMNDEDQDRFKAFQVDSTDPRNDYSILPAHPTKKRDHTGKSQKAAGENEIPAAA